MTQQCFIREVLGDGVPPKVAEVSCEFAVFPGSGIIEQLDAAVHTQMFMEFIELLLSFYATSQCTIFSA